MRKLFNICAWLLNLMYAFIIFDWLLSHLRYLFITFTVAITFDVDIVITFGAVTSVCGSRVRFRCKDTRIS